MPPEGAVATEAAEPTGAVDIFRQMLDAESDPPAEAPEAPEPAPEPAAEAPAGEEDSNPEEPQQGDEQPAPLQYQSLEDLAAALEVEPSALAQALKVGIKVDGQESAVTLEELRKGYQREADYRNKTSALAEQRKAYESWAQEQAKVLQQHAGQAQALISHVEESLVGEFKSVDWADLRQSDPAEFAAKRSEFAERAAQVQQMKQAAHQALAQSERQRQEAYQRAQPEILRREFEALTAKLPEWADREKFESERGELVKYLKAEGFEENEVSAWLDHRLIVLANKARQYDRMQSARPEVKRVVKEPTKVLRPGPKAPKGQAENEQFRKARGDLRKSGSVHDAAAIFRNFLLE